MKLEHSVTIQTERDLSYYWVGDTAIRSAMDTAMDAIAFVKNARICEGELLDDNS